jgi:hypothetical protein
VKSDQDATPAKSSFKIQTRTKDDVDPTGDESQPVQAKHRLVIHDDLSSEIATLREVVETIDETAEKEAATPAVGHQLFQIGTLTDKVPQFHLLAAGNPQPETTRVSPLYQITIDASLARDVAVAGD